MKIWRAPWAVLVAVYAAMGGVWAAFAYWAAPGIIVSGRAGHGSPVLGRLFQHHRSLPVEHYLGAWRGIAAAVLLALVLHLAIVLLARRMRRLRPGGEGPGGTTLIVFSTLFLAAAVISRIAGDYGSYVAEWTSVLQGRDPWGAGPVNAYGPLFNALAPLTLLSPLAAKLMCAFAYLVYVVWLTRAFAPRRGTPPPSWFWFGLLIFNLYPWQQIAWFGFFDILVGLACVACVHSLIRGKAGLAGAWLASGILLKFLPIVMLPFVAFDGRRLNVRLVGACLALVALGFGASVLIWGTSTFAPVILAVTRYPEWSIYNVVISTYSPLRLFPSTTCVEWLERSLFASAMLALFIWRMRRRIGPTLSCTLAILLTLIFYRVGFAHYQMVLFCLVSYWAASEWSSLRQRPLLVLFLIGYFNGMALVDMYYWEDAWRPVLDPNLVLLFQFVLGCLLLAALVRAAPAGRAGLAGQAPDGLNQPQAVTPP